MKGKQLKRERENAENGKGRATPTSTSHSVVQPTILIWMPKRPPNHPKRKCRAAVQSGREGEKLISPRCRTPKLAVTKKTTVVSLIPSHLICPILGKRPIMELRPPWEALLLPLEAFRLGARAFATTLTGARTLSNHSSKSLCVRHKGGCWERDTLWCPQGPPSRKKTVWPPSTQRGHHGPRRRKPAFAPWKRILELRQWGLDQHAGAWSRILDLRQEYWTWNSNMAKSLLDVRLVL